MQEINRKPWENKDILPRCLQLKAERYWLESEEAMKLGGWQAGRELGIRELGMDMRDLIFIDNLFSC